MVLGKLPVPGRPTILITVGQGPTALAVGAGGGCLDIFTLIYPFSPLSPSLWETARYRLKYCLKGPLNPKQPTNQILDEIWDLIESEDFSTCSWLNLGCIQFIFGLKFNTSLKFHANQTTKCLRNQGRTKGEGWSTAN